SNVKPGCLRFVMSLRAVGEGHLSSVVFRSGILNEECDLHLDDPGSFAVVPDPILNRKYEKKLFRKKLGELGLYNSFAKSVMSMLEETFTLDRLRDETTRQIRMDRSVANSSQAFAEGMTALAMSNYDV